MVTPPPSGQPADRALSAPVRANIEKWFSRRGVPQLIDEYATERQMDVRARPYVGAWLVGGSILWWGTRPDRSLTLNVASAIATLLTMALGVAAMRRVRGRVMWWVDRRLDAVDTFGLGPLIAVPSGLIEGSWLIGIMDGRNALLGMGAIYAIIGLGLASIAWWGIRRLREELARIAGLLGRTLPTLLILVLFLLFAAELWEAAHLLSTIELMATVFLLLAVAGLLVVNAFRSELPAMENADWAEMRLLAAETPALILLGAVPPGVPPPLGFLQRLNLGILVLFGQLIQSVFVALIVTGFLVLFGSLAIPATLQGLWIGATVTSLVHFELLGESRILSKELVTVATLLGSVVGLYFTGLAITDSAYRTAHFERMLSEVRQLIAARAYYAAAAHADPPDA